MKHFIYVCPFCNQSLDCDYSLNDKSSECPNCHNEIVPTINENLSKKITEPINTNLKNNFTPSMECEICNTLNKYNNENKIINCKCGHKYIPLNESKFDIPISICGIVSIISIIFCIYMLIDLINSSNENFGFSVPKLNLIFLSFFSAGLFLFFRFFTKDLSFFIKKIIAHLIFQEK